MKALKYIVFGILILGVIALAAYVGIWLMLVGGIVQVIDSAKAMPTDSMGVAIGVVRVLGAGFVGALTFWIGALLIAGLGALTSGGSSGRGNVSFNSSFFRGSKRRHL